MAGRSVSLETQRSAVVTGVLCVLAVLALGAVSCAAQQGAATEGKWISLFNGRDLTGWTLKIAGHALG